MFNHIVVALGNPGEQYKNSRHNAAWLVIDQFLNKENWQEEKKFKALILKETDTIFVKPLTYMNLSGDSVVKIMNYFKLLPKKFGFIPKKNTDLKNCLTVIHDDLDINLGEYKISEESGSAGHRGVQSIINKLGTKKFKRLRLGIKTPLLKNIIPAEKFVLQKFSPEELKQLLETAKYAWPKIIE
jgi:peptidyl-tRNA hydrolase, PTH1 family